MKKLIIAFIIFILYFQIKTIAQNVGVGISNPEFPLDIWGRLRIHHQGNNESAGIWLNNNTNTLLNTFLGIDENERFGIFSPIRGVNIFTADMATSNIGIGQTAPTFKLHVGEHSADGVRIEGPGFGSSTYRTLSIGGFGSIEVDKPGVTGGRFTIAENGNIGINKNNPTEKLDINGNLNLNGQLLANGVAGSANQVLVSNSSGQIGWGSLAANNNGQFKKFMGFWSSGTWTVPPGVNTIGIEVWGGGGGGNTGGGGGSGGYFKDIISVTPGQTYTVTIGAGGTGASTPTNGGASSFKLMNVYETEVDGGSAASSTNPGMGGIMAGWIGNGTFIEQNGESGMRNTISYTQKDATTFYENIIYGKGGDSPNSNQTGGYGAQQLKNSSTGANVYNTSARQGRKPGGGGGGGVTGGSSGGKGYAIIYW